MPERDKAVIPGLDAPMEQKDTSDVLSSAVPGGAVGAAGGAGVGFIESALSGKDYLRNTLAKALLGGVAGGTTSAYQAADPFQRGGVAGTAYQSAMKTMLGDILGGSSVTEAGKGGVQTALLSALTGQGKLKPEHQQSLVQQFTQSTLPTQKGWGRRIDLASSVAQQLSSGKPRTAYRGLKVMTKVMPDMDMRTAAEHALSRIESGRTRLPEEISALAALGKRIQHRLGTYRQATPALSSLSSMKKDFGSGKLDTKDFAQRIGLLTGRYGPQTEKAQRLRKFLQQVIARPVKRMSGGKNGLMQRTMRNSPDVANLVMSALER